MEDSLSRFIQGVGGGGEPLRGEHVEQAILAGEEMKVALIERRQALIEGDYGKAAELAGQVAGAFSTMATGDAMLHQIVKLSGEAESVERHRRELLEGVPDEHRSIITSVSGLLGHMMEHLTKARLAVLEDDWLEVANHLADVHSEAEMIFNENQEKIEAAGNQPPTQEQKEEGPPRDYANKDGDVRRFDRADATFVEEGSGVIWARLPTMADAMEKLGFIEKYMAEHDPDNPMQDVQLLVGVPDGEGGYSETAVELTRDGWRKAEPKKKDS